MLTSAVWCWHKGSVQPRAAKWRRVITLVLYWSILHILLPSVPPISDFGWNQAIALYWKDWLPYSPLSRGTINNNQSSINHQSSILFDTWIKMYFTKKVTRSKKSQQLAFKVSEQDMRTLHKQIFLGSNVYAMIPMSKLCSPYFLIKFYIDIIRHLGSYW